MAGEFEVAGDDIIRRLRAALSDVAVEIMVESIQECPISGPDTYVPQVREIGGKKVFLGDDPAMVGDNGTLRRSARVFAPVSDGDSIMVEMGYGFGDEVNPAGRVAAEYAVPVHELHDLHHDPPTKSGYLLDPVLAHAGDFGAEVAARMLGSFPAEQATGLVVAEGIDLGAE